MSTVSRVQHLLGVIAHAKVNAHPVQMITSHLTSAPAAAQPAAPAAQAPTDSLPAAAPSMAWDPHEVWVNHIKKPRDLRSA